MPARIETRACISGVAKLAKANAITGTAVMRPAARAPAPNAPRWWGGFQ